MATATATPNVAAPPKTVGVVGGGIMGQGIAALFAAQGVNVTIFDVTEAQARAAVEKLGDPDQKLQQLTTKRHLKRFANDAGHIFDRVGETHTAGRHPARLLVTVVFAPLDGVGDARNTLRGVDAKHDTAGARGSAHPRRDARALRV